MCSRWVVSVALLAPLLAGGCHHPPSPQVGVSAPVAGDSAVVTSALTPGLDHSVATVDPRARPYYDSAAAVAAGQRLFAQYNCSGCHSNGGGGMGPSLMDDEWIYGGRLEQIHQTLVEGRPNGMPSWGGKVPDEQLWQIAAYVRSMSLPRTLAAETGDTPSQSPAPVPLEAEQDSGWSPPPQTTNDYTSTLTGPQ